MKNFEAQRRLSQLTAMDRLITAFLALFFGLAAIDKLLHAPGFVRAIDSYRLLPVPMGTFLAPVVIAAELVVAIGLLRSSWRRAASLQSTVLLTVFTIGLLGNRLSGAGAICGCWFSISMAQGDMHFALNGTLLAMSVLLWRACRSDPANRHGQAAARSQW